MIEISMLTEKDIGREVVYKGYEDDNAREYGVISSWNDRFIFVVYDGHKWFSKPFPEFDKTKKMGVVCR
jgi:hypothetical protein